MHPEITASPADTFTGTGSPVTGAVSILLSPAVTTPSSGMRSPTRTTTRSPMFAWAAGCGVREQVAPFPALSPLPP